ncbi:Hypothetical protein I595_3544 [Croceitalea dokdonensis DOKDO 023]|uniref:Uncharacterized protein n=1 Tax=Croceitalea dokdonensis DOKDO 023 TaxID=1300341 RepID=A0A0P7ARI2_9FLAO|nr:Hypothetical protein I595_3544 [Croceitalea dokdonensis DOKDO 023]
MGIFIGLAKRVNDYLVCLHITFFSSLERLLASPKVIYPSI